ncbi:MAG TPA: hypothetical protein VEV81_11830 [Pyrinomonadaceae bacterium]|nr:hypothetical protein [Pyrinomonadaceae bacterium]
MMKVRTLIFATILALSCALTAAAQGGIQCDIKPARAPELRGLRLEMTLSQVKARYPKLPAGSADSLGQQRLGLTRERLAEIDPVAFKGVEDVFLYFIDDRLVSFAVTYPDLPWKGLAQFTARMGEALNLPDGWHGDQYRQMLDCNGFQVVAGTRSSSAVSMSNYLQFTEPGAEGIIRGREEKQREQQLQSFRP